MCIYIYIHMGSQWFWESLFCLPLGGNQIATRPKSPKYGCVDPDIRCEMGRVLIWGTVYLFFWLTMTHPSGSRMIGHPNGPLHRRAHVARGHLKVGKGAPFVLEDRNCPVIRSQRVPGWGCDIVQPSHFGTSYGCFDLSGFPWNQSDIRMKSMTHGESRSPRFGIEAINWSSSKSSFWSLGRLNFQILEADELPQGRAGLSELWSLLAICPDRFDGHRTLRMGW